MSRWFRFYECALDDPKVQRLPDNLFKTWVNLLCIASKGNGYLPSVGDIAFALRITEEEAQKRLVALQQAGLFDESETGLRPHNWDARQFRSDTSSERVKRYRERFKSVTPTVSVTPPDTDTDTDTDTEKINVASVDAGLFEIQDEKKVPSRKSLALASKFFDEFWTAYPKRTGSNPKEPARKSYLKATGSGDVSPVELLAATKRFAASDHARDPQFVPMASTWLNQKRWQEYANGNALVAPAGEVVQIRSLVERIAVTERELDYDNLLRTYRAQHGRSPLTINGTVHYPAEWIITHRGKLDSEEVKAKAI